VCAGLKVLRTVRETDVAKKGKGLKGDHGGSRWRCGTPALEKASERASQLARIGRLSFEKSLPKDHRGSETRGKCRVRGVRS